MSRSIFLNSQKSSQFIQPCNFANKLHPHSPKMIPHNSSFSLNPQQSKEKSELCRQFMEFGICPYRSRCKFAHGSHQLLKNQQSNCKYKTKRCEKYARNMFCLYGNRCNFIHESISEQMTTKDKEIDVIIELIRLSHRKGSRLLKLLQHCDIV